MIYLDLHARWRRSDLFLVPMVPRAKVPYFDNSLELAELTLKEADNAAKEWGLTTEILDGALLLGRASRLSAVKLQVKNPALLRRINQLLPQTGLILFYGEAEYRLFAHNEVLENVKLFEPGGDLPAVEFIRSGQAIHISHQTPVPTLKSVQSAALLTGGQAHLLIKTLNDEGLAVSEAVNEGLQRAVYLLEAEEHIKRRFDAVKLASEVFKGSSTLLNALRSLEADTNQIIDRLTRQNGEPPTSFDAKAINQLMVSVLVRVANFNQKGLHPNTLRGMTPEMAERYDVPFHLLDNQHTEKDLRAWFRAAIAKAQDENEKTSVVDTFLKMLGRSRNLPQTHIQGLLTYAANQAGIQTSMHQLHQNLKVEFKHHFLRTQPGELVDDLQARLDAITEWRYHARQLFFWTGSHWRVFPQFEVTQMLSSWYSDYSFVNGVKQIETLGAMLRDRYARPLVSSVTAGANFRNGVLTSQGQLIPHDPGMGMTYVLPFHYDPHRPTELHRAAPRFHMFLQDCWGKDPDYQEKVTFLQQAIGVTLFGQATLYQRVFLLHGVAQSGKSQLLTILREIMPPEIVCAVSPSEWRFPEKVGLLSHCRINLVGELSATKSIPSDVFKDVVDGQPQIASQSNGALKARVTKPIAAHWFASNHVPLTKDTTAGFYRRWSALTFNHPVPSNKIVRDLGATIAREEAVPIMSWAVQGFLQLQDEAEFKLPPSHHDYVVAMLAANSHLMGAVLDPRYGGYKPTPALKELVTELGNQTTLTEDQRWQLIMDCTKFCTLPCVNAMVSLGTDGKSRYRTCGNAPIIRELRDAAQALGLLMEMVDDGRGFRLWGVEPVYFEVKQRTGPSGEERIIDGVQALQASWRELGVEMEWPETLKQPGKRRTRAVLDAIEAEQGPKVKRGPGRPRRVH